tara:strand:+ start:279 stop:1343 length:1065 start_codon:yes stop_codon:yes gene_type:complete
MKIVLKFGTSTLIDEKGEPKLAVFSEIASIVNELNKKHSLTIVASGAAMIGAKKLGFRNRPKKIEELQVASSLGQVSLMNSFIESFQKFKVNVSQVLLTKNILEDRQQYLNTKMTLNLLIEKKIVPVINENDTVSTEELRYGDNDRLSAMVAQIITADKLIIFTDTEGLFYSNPELVQNPEIVESIEYKSEELEEILKTADSKKGIGGFATKILASQIAGYSGIDTHITDWNADNLDLILRGEKIGTHILPSSKKIPSRKLWIGFGMVSTSTITVDTGAEEALVNKNASLLYKGISEYGKEINIGDCITVFNTKGAPIAKGISSWSSDEIDEAFKINNRGNSKPVMHKDNLIIL